MSEKDLQDAVIDLARRLGYMCAHFRPAQTQTGRWVTAMQGDTGFPDLTVVGHGCLFFFELKAAKGRVSQEQARWLAELGRVSGVEARVVRPADWLDGTVEAVLRGQA